MFAALEILLYIVIPAVVGWFFTRFYVTYAENHCDICGHHWMQHFMPGFDGCPVHITWNQRCRCLAVQRISTQTWSRRLGRGILFLRQRPVPVEKG